MAKVIETQGRFARVWNWFLSLTGTRKLILILVLALTIPVGFYVLQTGADRFSSYLSDRSDARHEKVVREVTKEAVTHEDNANSHDSSRQAKEDEYSEAHARQEQASQNSARTVAPTRRARTRYEETRRTRTRNMPDLSDDALCAELEARGIECQ